MTDFPHYTQRSAAMRRAGLLPGIVLLETNISRIRKLSTEDGFPAWRIAAVVASAFFISQVLIFVSLLELPKRKRLSQ